jgi:hypothetical protein
MHIPASNPNLLASESIPTQNGQLHLISSDACYLETQAEVYDAELHAVHSPDI